MLLLQNLQKTTQDVMSNSVLICFLGCCFYVQHDVNSFSTFQSVSQLPCKEDVS